MAYSLSYRDIEEIMKERGFEVDHGTELICGRDEHKKTEDNKNGVAFDVQYFATEFPRGCSVPVVEKFEDVGSEESKMAIQYFTSINETDKAKTLLLIDASIQAYHAFNKDTPAECQTEKIISPAGYEFVECWTGIDAIFSENKTVENYGIVFRSQVSPYTYIFAFRGTSSFLDILDDLGARSKAFTPHNTRAQVPFGVKVESGFFDVYSERDGPTPSM